MSKFINFFQKLGPAIVFAGAAVGVSHLVQASRAGANFGYQLMGFVILVHILKYPFFEYGNLYAASTGESLIFAYKKINKYLVHAYIVFNLAMVSITQAAVTIITAGLMANLFPSLNLSISLWSLILLILCSVILILGHYKWLERVSKVILLILSISLIASVSLSFMEPSHSITFQNGELMEDIFNTEIVQQATKKNIFSWSKIADFSFLIAMMGWMPAPMDFSIWNSIWTKAKLKGSSGQEHSANALFDSKVGYILTASLAVLFLVLGAKVVHSHGASLPNGAVDFSAALINMFTESLGDWAKPIISIAAFATMFSTTLTCLDGYPRVIVNAITELKSMSTKTYNTLYHSMIAFAAVTTMIVILFFTKNMKAYIDFITIVSFLCAPVFAFINYRVIFKSDFPEDYQPGKINRNLAKIGLMFLSIFSLVFVWFKVF
ncbi:MAG: divalent metal cation transporter [Candidatus Caenarcaniphilales bacterium]|nr:divalent metal cation transporter [Candidatus Caenarcaniphilales bacterium]